MGGGEMTILDYYYAVIALLAFTTLYDLAKHLNDINGCLSNINTRLHETRDELKQVVEHMGDLREELRQARIMNDATTIREEAIEAQNRAFLRNSQMEPES
jgi:hypothetical protein